MNITTIIGIPSIMIISYFITEGFKLFIKKKYLPTVVGLSGAVIGVIIYFIDPNSIFAEDIITAIAVGITSGLAATGSDQAIKKLIGKEEKNE